MKAFSIFQKKEETFLYKLRNYLREYATISNIHGVRYLAEKRSRAEKMFWVTVLFISLSVCPVIICGIWERYKSNPIVISFASATVPVYEISFPAVTICLVTKCAQSKFNFTDIRHKIDDNKTITEEEKRIFHYVDLICDTGGTLGPDETFGDEFFKIINQVKPNVSIGCTFLDMECNCDQYFTPVITDGGICYSFNIADKELIFRENVVFLESFYEVKYNITSTSNQCQFVKNKEVDMYPLRAVSSGHDNAFEVFLSHDRFDDDFECTGFYEGYQILVHSPFDIPRPSKHYIHIAVDKTTLIAVQPGLVRTSPAVEKFHPDTRKCYLAHERPLKYFKQYSQSNCYLECLTNYTLQKCECALFYMPREKNTPICAQKKYDCPREAEDQMKMEELTKKLSGSKKTFCDCQPSCTELTYSVETTHIDLPAEHAEQEKLASIYFKNEQFMAVEREVLRGISNLISEFGGLLGLFTGFSLMSLVEVIYFFTIRIFYNQQLYNNWSESIC